MKFENHHFIIGKKKIYKNQKIYFILIFSLMPNRALSHDSKKTCGNYSCLSSEITRN